MASNIRLVGSQLAVNAQSLVISLYEYTLEERADFMSQVLAAFCVDCWRPASGAQPCDCKTHPLWRKRNEPSEVVDFVQCDGCERRVLYAHHERTTKAAPLVLPREGEKPNIAVRLVGGYPDSSAEAGETLVWQYRILTKRDPELHDDESRQKFLSHFANCQRAQQFRRKAQQ